jgi:exopolysaccharide biosynthesis protein
VLKNGNIFIGDREHDFPIFKDNLRNALGGGVFLVKDYAQVPQTIPTVTARTAVGITVDNVLYFIIVDGGNFYHSNGINYADLSAIMKAIGVKDAINIDGGGSSTCMIKNPIGHIWQVRNKPQDGDPRAIATSWLLTSSSQH